MDTTPGVDLEAGLRSEVISRLDANGVDDHVGFDRPLGCLEAGKGSTAIVQLLCNDTARVAPFHERHTHVLDLFENKFSGCGVQLAAEGIVASHLDGDIEAEIVYRFGGFQTEQTASNNGGCFRSLGVVENCVQVRHGAINE
jgi:hypothetical protein